MLRRWTSRPALIGRIALAPVLAVAVLPFLAAPASAASFTVNSTADATDASPGNGVCATATGTCTLRAAIQEANALAGADTITLPAGEFAITIPGLNQNDITTGDLDITGDLTITGAGQTATVIDGGPPPPGSPPDRVGLDRIFEVAPGVGSVTLSGVKLQDGWAPEFGGALFNGGNADIGLTDVTVANGFAGKNGGGLGNHGTGTVTITGSTFTGNDSVEGGSAINNQLAGTVTVANSTITSNTGGAAILNNGELSTQGTLSVTDSTISNNGGSPGVSKPGGGINNERGSLTVLRTTFTSNTATGDGGAINNSTGTVSVTGSTFTTNNGTNGGALATDATGGSVTVAGSTFDGNTAGAEGGAVNINGGTLTVTNSTIRNNTATTDGGGISNNNSGNVTLTTVTLTNNTAASGGGLATHDGSTTTITGSTFTGNHATASGLAGDGGAILNDGGPFILRDSTLTGNDAFDGGGLANLGDAASELTNITVSTNTADQDGGGLSLHSGFITATNLTVTGNTAARDGGGISYMADAATEITAIGRSLIADNVATVHGGGIDSRGDGPLTMDETTIRANQARDGGGIHHVGDAPITVKRSTVSANQGVNGGGLTTDGDGDTNLENSTVSGNTATGFGGGVLVSSRAFLVHTTVTSNNAPANAGGGINNGGGDLFGDGFVFPRNSIIALNPTGGNCVGTITSQGGNLENTNTCQLTAEGDQVNVADSKIGPLALNGGPTDTHALLALSPALNNAIIGPIPATDQRSVPRPQGFQADIGSFESTTPGCTGTVRVISASDSWVNQGDPNKNNGADAILKVTSKSPATNTRALVRFDLPALGAGCQVAGATLEAYAASATTGRTIQALPVAAPWTESTVTWNNQPATTGSAATTASGLGTRTWNVTTQVQAMYTGANHGFLLRDAEGDPASPQQQYHAREKAPDRPPRLIVTFG